MVDKKLDFIDSLCQIPVTYGCFDPKQKQCSPLFSKSEVGDWCRKQYGKLTDGERDTIILDYCLKYQDALECKCANRGDNPDYVKLKKGNPFMDSCWYIPCANRSRYFIDSSFNKNTPCPSNICRIVYDISKVNNVDIHNIEADINCDFSHGGDIPDPTALPSWIYILILFIIAAFIFVYTFKT